MTPPLTIAMSGGRDWQDEQAPRMAVSELPPGTRILVGDNPKGLDAIVRSWKTEVKQDGTLWWDIAEFKAEWSLYGLPAGPIRNGWILDHNPAFVLAFHRSLYSGSKGTLDMVRQARARGIPVILFEREGGRLTAVNQGR